MEPTALWPDAYPPTGRRRHHDRLRLVMIAMAVLIGWLGASLWRQQRIVHSLGELPPEVQQATYQNTLQELSTTCMRERERLADHCRAQAEFLQAFPQCDDACKQLARRFLPSASR